MHPPSSGTPERRQGPARDWAPRPLWKRTLIWLLEVLYNRPVRRAWLARHRDYLTVADPDLRLVRERSLRSTDVASHLETLYRVVLELRPRLIVELGVRGGESTFAFSLAARRTGARHLGVDLVDCSETARHQGWLFVQSDDVELGARFPSWARQRGLPSSVDLLFVDTSHLYRHTRQEIGAWFPHLSERAAAIFHDTNLRYLYRRHDRTLGFGWNNRRGVVRALEELLGRSLDERRSFELEVDEWRIVHHPICNGLTVLRRGG